MQKSATIAFIQEIFSKEKFNGEFYNLLAGHVYYHENGKQFQTGLIKSKHIITLLRQYSFINWYELCKYTKYIANHEIRYIMQTIQFIINTPRIVNEFPINEEEESISICYISTHPAINNPEVEIEANTYFSYGFAGIYTSSYTNDFSECTYDIFKDRYSENIYYDKGVIVTVDNQSNSNFLYVSRKHNMPYMAHFIKKYFKAHPEYTKYEPSFKDVDEWGKKTTQLLDYLNNEGVDNSEQLQKIIELANVKYFSFIGYLLFEIIHEYFVISGCDIFTANQYLRILSPNQYVLWSMRGFKISNYRELMLKCGVLLKDFNEKDFCSYLVDQFKYRILLFVGKDRQYLRDCNYVSLFCRDVHFIEMNKVDMEVRSNIVRSDLFKKYVEKYNLVYENIDIDTLQILDFPRSVQLAILDEQEGLQKEYFQSIFDQYNIKKIYSDIRNNIARTTLDIISEYNLGCVVANLQPDDRGEYLLLPSESMHTCSSFRLNPQMERDGIVDGKKFKLIRKGCIQSC